VGVGVQRDLVALGEHVAVDVAEIGGWVEECWSRWVSEVC
jgi:hypothetical protein